MQLGVSTQKHPIAVSLCACGLDFARVDFHCARLICGQTGQGCQNAYLTAKHRGTSAVDCQAVGAIDSACKSHTRSPACGQQVVLAQSHRTVVGLSARGLDGGAIEHGLTGDRQ